MILHFVGIYLQYSLEFLNKKGHIDMKNPALTATLAVAIVMAIWWVTEIIPLGITSLLPIVLLLRIV